MTDTARLQITATSDGIETATGRLSRLTKQGQKAEGATKSLTGAFTKMLPAIGVVASITQGFTKLVAVTREFDILNASLITATGSADNAAIAFEAIQDFATTTPYNLQQATDGFAKLVNLGLTPSERALTSYGNTAAAMGKDLSQMIEAVADAATGEFERLKEFGIKSRQQGDEVAFTFRGVTTTVKKNAAEIEGYLMALGENEFAGAMANRMDTLDGAMSNLEDTWNQFFLAVSQEDVGGMIEGSVRQATAALQELTDQVRSGQATAYLHAYGTAWSGVIDGIADAWNSLTKLVMGNLKAWQGESTITGNFIADAFLTLPANMKAMFTIATAEIERAMGYAKMAAGAVSDFLNAALNPNSGTTVESVTNNVTRQMEKMDAAVSRAYAHASTERKKSIGVVKEEIQAADKLREAYDREREASKNATGDRLAQFGKGPQSTGGSTTSAPSAASKKASEKAQREYDQLILSLRSEEEVIEDSYNRRLALIQANTVAESEERTKLMEKVKEIRDQDMADLEEKRGAELERVKNSMLTEEEELLASFERKRGIILNATEITEEERMKLTKKLEDKYAKDTANLERQRASTIFKSSADLFGDLADLSSQFAGEQSGIFKVMFAASKAFAIADSIMKIQTGVANASALPFPSNLAAMGTVVAATAGIVSTISSVQMKGFRKGGYTGQGGVDDVAGVVHGQEYVFDAESTNRIGKDNLDNIRRGGSGGKGGLSLVINNYITMGNSGVGSDTGMEDQLRAVMNDVSQQVQSDIINSIEENGIWAQIVGG